MVPIDKETALKRLSNVPDEFGLLRLIPGTWLYNVNEAFVLISQNSICASDEIISLI